VPRWLIQTLPGIDFYPAAGARRRQPRPAFGPAVGGQRGVLAPSRAALLPLCRAGAERDARDAQTPGNGSVLSPVGRRVRLDQGAAAATRILPLTARPGAAVRRRAAEQRRPQSSCVRWTGLQPSSCRARPVETRCDARPSSAVRAGAAAEASDQGSARGGSSPSSWAAAAAYAANSSCTSSATL
jgi:hypothetical protein